MTYFRAALKCRYRTTPVPTKWQLLPVLAQAQQSKSTTTTVHTASAHRPPYPASSSTPWFQISSDMSPFSESVLLSCVQNEETATVPRAVQDPLCCHAFVRLFVLKSRREKEERSFCGARHLSFSIAVMMIIHLLCSASADENTREYLKSFLQQQ